MNILVYLIPISLILGGCRSGVFHLHGAQQSI